jgi:hypothetical protein
MLKKQFTLNLSKEQLYTLIDTLDETKTSASESIDDGCFDSDKEELEHQINKVVNLKDMLAQVYKQDK